jgi:hypothetical protein
MRSFVSRLRCCQTTGRDSRLVRCIRCSGAVAHRCRIGSATWTEATGQPTGREGRVPYPPSGYPSRTRSRPASLEAMALRVIGRCGSVGFRSGSAAGWCAGWWGDRRRQAMTVSVSVTRPSATSWRRVRCVDFRRHSAGAGRAAHLGRRFLRSGGVASTSRSRQLAINRSMNGNRIGWT